VCELTTRPAVAEKVFRALTKLSSQYRSVHFIAVSHSSPETTERWVVSVGGDWEVELVIDEERELYSQYGLGVSSSWHVLNPVSLYKVFQLGRTENIWNRPTESGTRWQTAGAFAVDRDGLVKWAHVARTADDMPDLNEALKALGVNLEVKHHDHKHDRTRTHGETQQ
jgi:peroxiredoxin